MPPTPPIRLRVQPVITDSMPDGPRIRRWLGAQDRGELAGLPLASPEDVLIDVIVRFATQEIDEAVNRFLNQLPPGAPVTMARTVNGCHLFASDADGKQLDLPRLDLSIVLAR